MPSPARDRVFISYSHRDAEWMDKVLIFLKPFLRAGTLSIWNDRYIEVGGLWRREIDDGLQRAAVGLLLVSPYFLDSDFIMDEELPALVAAAEQGLLKLVWMPIGACHWKHSPLRDYQAAWDPGQPLDSLAEDRRNAALVQITEGVADAAKMSAGIIHYAGHAMFDDTAGPKVPRRQEATVPTINLPRETLAPGDLHNVPDPPPHYVPRAGDLDRLRGSLLKHDSAAVGITGEPYRVGLHGQGGIGKSVLAAALARAEQVRLAFPDGVFWVTVGQAPDVPRLQAALLAEAGADSAAVTDEPKGRALLQERFAGRAVLLVLDDLWDHRHARAFDVLDPASRLLVTTRDGAVLTAVGAQPETVQRLPEAAALALLSSWAGHDGGALPEVAREVARECGHLPLALSLAGARVQDGTTWELLLTALKQGRLEFLDHPYGSVFGSMRLSVDALPTRDRERYLELAVFPEDEWVPVPVVLTLWKQTAALDELAGEALLSRLRSKALLEMLDTDGRREVALHDLQHDFLRLSVRDLPSLHERLLVGLAAELPAADGIVPWWLLPTDAPYAWIHLAWHLVAAGRGEELRDLLFDCRWLEAKLRAAGLPALLADFAALPPDEELSLITGALRLSGHVIGRDPSQLRSQLTGRLLEMDWPRIAGMLRGAVMTLDRPWLRPTVPSLTPPIGPLLRTLAHADWVETVAVTADGQRAVSGSRDGTVKVWDLETGAEERTLVGHTGWVEAVAVRADGRSAVSGSADGTVRVWDLETGAEKHTLAGHAGGVRAVAMTANGRRAVSGADDGAVKVWDLETGTEERTLAGHAGWILAVALTADGRRALSGSSDRAVKVWDLEKGANEQTLVGHAASVTAVAVTADGQRAISGSADGTMKVWNLETGAEKRVLAGHAVGVTGVTMTEDGRRAVSASNDGIVKAWHLETGAEERMLGRQTHPVTAVAVTADGLRALTASRDRTVKVWDLERDTEERPLEGYVSWVSCVVMTPDGRRAVSGYNDGTVTLWNLETGAEERRLGHHTSAVTATAMTADGWYAVTGCGNGILKIWDLETGEKKRTLAGHAGGVAAIAVTADGRRAVSGSYKGTVKLWNLETGAEERTLAGHVGPVRAVAVTADGQRVVSGSDDQTVKVWNLETGEEESTLAGHTGLVRAVAVEAGGRHAVSGSDDRTVKVWDLETGAVERTLTGHVGDIMAVAVTPDGRSVVSGSRDGEVKAWDLASGGAIATFTTDTPVGYCAVAADGMRLIAGDGFVRVHFLSLELPTPANEHRDSK